MTRHPFAAYAYAIRSPRSTFAVHEDPPAPKPKIGDILRQHGLQDDFDAIIETRLAEDRRRRSTGLPPEVETELGTLRKFKTETERQAEEAKANYEAAKKSILDEAAAKEQQWNQQREGLLSTIRHDRINTALILAATNAGAVDASDIAVLLAGRIELDKDHNVVVLDDNKRPWLKGGQPVTVTQLVAWHKQQKPNLYAAKDAGPGDGEGSGAGGGDGEGAGGGTKNGVSDAELAAAQKAYDEAHATAKESPSAANVDASVAARRKLEALTAKREGKGGKK